MEQVTSIGQIKPELYKQRSGESDSKKGEAASCGRLSFALRYAYGTEQLVVRILRGVDLPAKDANGFSDPYVKMYLLPDRKKKFQTKVHRKTLNPIFNETFNFNVPFAELPSRKLHFSVYDFDRFSRHDLIGQVVLDNLLELAERDSDSPLWRDIMEASSVSGGYTGQGGRNGSISGAVASKARCHVHPVPSVSQAIKPFLICQPSSVNLTFKSSAVGWVCQLNRPVKPFNHD